MAVNERQIALRVGGTFSTLTEFLNRRIVKTLPFVITQELAVSTAEFALIPSTKLSGTIGVGVASVTNGSYIAAELAGAVGTAATTNIADSNGNILNMVSIRDTNGDEIQYGTGATAKTVYGLIQCSNGTTDGDAIGGVGSENLQISFVYYNGGTLTLVSLNQTIQFQGNKLFLQRNLATIEKETGNLVPDILQRAVASSTRKFIVTAPFAANEVITLFTGAGGVSGTSTPSGDTMTLNASSSDMIADNTCNIFLNGVRQRKGTEFIWDSTTTGHFSLAMDIGDHFEIDRLI
jgi:hypothetical protein